MVTSFDPVPSTMLAELHEDKVVIRQKKSQANKEIPLKKLAGVKLKKAGLSAGYLHFYTHAGLIPQSNSELYAHPATVVFSWHQNKRAVAFKAQVDERIGRSGS